MNRQNYLGRAIALYFRLNADRMNYTPGSHRGRRAARLMPRVKAAIEAHQ